MKPKILLLTGVFILVSSLPLKAQEDPNELKEQIKALQKRVEELESQQRVAPTNRSPFGQGDWNPFAEMERMQREMDRLFADAYNDQTAPSGMFSSNMVFNQELNLKETDKGYEITFDMVGLNKDKIDLQINKNSITVSGQYQEEHKEENPNSIIQSSRFGTFLKTIPLPVDADTSKMTTEQKGNELVITLPKK